MPRVNDRIDPDIWQPSTRYCAEGVPHDALILINSPLTVCTKWSQVGKTPKITAVLPLAQPLSAANA